MKFLDESHLYIYFVFTSLSVYYDTYHWVGPLGVLGETPGRVFLDNRMMSSVEDAVVLKFGNHILVPIIRLAPLALIEFRLSSGVCKTALLNDEGMEET